MFVCVLCGVDLPRSTFIRDVQLLGQCFLLPCVHMREEREREREREREETESQVKDVYIEAQACSCSQRSVCVCVCMCVCMRVCVRVCVCVCVCVRAPVVWCVDHSTIEYESLKSGGTATVCY